MRRLEIEEEGALLPEASQDAGRRNFHRLAFLVVAGALFSAALLLKTASAGKLRQAQVEEATVEDSEPMKCLPCHEKECTLGFNEWTKCPADRPYFSEVHCKCVSSEVCYDDSPRAATCQMCQNCFEHACHIGEEYVTCSKESPWYSPATSSCQESCDETSLVMEGVPEAPVIIPFVCPKSTYGKCEFTSCHSDRGPTVCSSGECICQLGHCAYRGKCLPEIDYDKAEHLCQDNTFSSCRFWNCPSSLGPVKCDGFWGGYGTYNCLCEAGNCYDPDKVACVPHEKPSPA